MHRPSRASPPPCVLSWPRACRYAEACGAWAGGPPLLTRRRCRQPARRIHPNRSAMSTRHSPSPPPSTSIRNGTSTEGAGRRGRDRRGRRDAAAAMHMRGVSGGRGLRAAGRPPHRPCRRPHPQRAAPAPPFRPPPSPPSPALSGPAATHSPAFTGARNWDGALAKEEEARVVCGHCGRVLARA